MHAVLRLVVVVVAALLALTGCGSASTVAAPAVQASPTAGARIIDVRTPSEFAAGHVEGALNLDVQAPDFPAEVAALPSDGAYLVYCRSGQRAARAAQIMRAAGLTVTNGGGLADMRAAGYRLSG